MRVGTSTRLLRTVDLSSALEWLDESQLAAATLDYESHVEGAFDGTVAEVADEIRSAVGATDVSLEAIAAFGNPLHPDDASADRVDRMLRDAVELAAELDVGIVSCYSGLPGASPSARYPNWITILWPCEMEEAYDYQWEVAVSYWSEVAEFAAEHGVDIAIEMHPNTLVYEPSGLLALRAATNDGVKAAFNPGNLVWMNVDPATALRYLSQEDAVSFLKAKDVAFREEQTKRKGVLDPTAIPDPKRSWTFRTVGRGRSEEWWTEVVSAAADTGWTGYIELEQEDAEVPPAEGVELGAEFLCGLEPP